MSNLQIYRIKKPCLDLIKLFENYYNMKTFKKIDQFRLPFSVQDIVEKILIMRMSQFHNQQHLTH